jgi:RNA polymerase sigma factor (sigma-70 family)
MTNRPLGAAVRYLRTLTDLQSAATAADGQLLDRFARTRDEAAFAALLRRHGPMVLAVCRRALGRYQDAEDAFQATFLLLARKAASIRQRESVGSWLHGVARRLALKAKGRDDRQRMNEERAASMRKTETGVQAAWGDLREALDEALQRLPEHYRTALVICHLEGRTHEEAARHLGCPTATLRSRLTRGRKLLRTELTRRGLTLSAGALGAALLVSTAEAAPALLLDATLRAALLFAVGKGTAGAVSASATALANEGLKAMGIMKTQIVVMLLAALSLVGVGVGAMAQQSAVKPPEPEAPPAAKRQANLPQKHEAQVRLDDDGDPLPDGAVRRVGTLRFRQGGGDFDSLLVTPDGKTLVSSTFYGDRTICAWDLATGKLLRSFPGSYDFGQIALSPDGTTLAAPHQDDNVIVLSDLASGKELRRLAYQDFFPCSCAFSPDGKTLVSGDQSGFIDFWDLTTRKHIERRKSPNNRVLPNNHVTLLAFTPDGKTLASGDHQEGAITLWDAASGKVIRQLKRSGVVLALTFSPDGAFLACVGGDADSKKKYVIPLWDVKTGKIVHEMPSGYAWSVAFTPDGKTVASAEAEDDQVAIVLRDVSSGKRLRTIADNPERITFSPDGKTLISGYRGGVIRLWDVETGKEKTPAQGRSWIRNATASPKGRTLVFCDLKVRLWDLIEGREVGALPIECHETAGLSFSGDGKTLATVDSNHDISLWDVGARKLLRRIERDENAPHYQYRAALAPNGKMLATAQDDAAVMLWDTATGKKLQRLTILTPGEDARQPFLSGIAFAPDGDRLAASVTTHGSGSRVRFWDVTPDGGEPRVLWDTETPSEGNRAPSGSPWLDQGPQVVFSPDGRMLSMNRYQKTIPVWEAATGKQRLLLTGHTESTCFVAFAPDGRTLASSGYDDTIRLWDMGSGEELRSLKGHRGKANSLAFSADGETLVSTGDDTTMLFWDVTEITHRPRPKPSPLSPEECKSLWNDLAGADAAKTYQAIRAFSMAPRQTASFLAERLRPARSVKKEEVDRLIADLDSDDFQIRDKATSELDELGDTIQSALRKVIDGRPSAEVRSRVNRLLEKLATPAPELLRHLRALEALEADGGADARQVVERIATGAAEARLTREAKASLKRMGE